MIVDIKSKLGQTSPPTTGANGVALPVQVGKAMLPQSEVQPLPIFGQDVANYFDPSLAELNADLLEIDWSTNDWNAMSGFGWP